MIDHVARGSEVRTDAWIGYDDIGRYRFKHVVTDVSATGDPAHVALPHGHLVASLVKRWVLGTRQGAISHAQLDYSSMSSPAALTADAHDTEAAFSTASSRLRWQRIPGRTSS